MYANECMPYGTDRGCAAHSQPDCLCDVEVLEAGVPIRSIPFAERLLELGVNRVSFAAWAEEVAAWQESQGLQLVADL
ncbi:MAG TPA: hypothetical protein VI854_01945 [Acidimicrobiia bacterium]|nr:hypothetical protein [Acidimicrobiia bacterium]